jgi:hypothetical protein
MNTTTAHGLTMQWSLCRSHRGNFVIHGWVGREQRMEHGMGRTMPSPERQKAAVLRRLAIIAQASK